MISDNTKIIMALNDTLDYAEYTAECLSKGRTPDNIGLFLQIAGMVLGAKRRNRDNFEQGYLEIVDEMNHAFHLPPSHPASQPGAAMVRVAETPCGGCGGGNVR